MKVSLSSFGVVSFGSWFSSPIEMVTVIPSDFVGNDDTKGLRTKKSRKKMKLQIAEAGEPRYVIFSTSSSDSASSGSASSLLLLLFCY
ncbi:unnamed protein product [Ilex paraguariensis]|uniref:Uncharacterized protein n=1 Tax=Ilex paraguariensis TaxID=185542 RepID=A0ABC8R1N7_9AQUA